MVWREHITMPPPGKSWFLKTAAISQAEKFNLLNHGTSTTLKFALLI